MRAKLILPAIAAGLVVLAGCDIEDLGGFERYHEDFHYNYPLKAGGRLGMGGDYGFGWNPHGDYAKELTFFVKHAGLSPLEVIRCATKTGAEIMGRGAELGTLEKGKLADVLVVDGDVAADISLLEERQKFIAVIQGGVVKAGQALTTHPRD